MKATEWRPLAEAHRQRADAALSGRRQDPIEDFLWSYYRTRPVHLTFWHPGVGVELEDAPEYVGRRGYVTADGRTQVDPDFVAKHLPLIQRIRHLLTSTQGRVGKYGCYGMHEWAMVYRAPEVRHSLPLRFSTDEVAEIVDEVGLRCSHYDAFRFFAAPARPLNVIQPTRERQPELDQPGCIHANMDLLKWSLKLLPLIPSSLVLDAFVNARQLRLLDMQASPYDLSTLGLAPVKVETDTGRREYQVRQQQLARESEPIRRELIDALSLIDISETNAGAVTTHM